MATPSPRPTRDRNGRRDDAVAEEHARAENDQERQPRRLRQHAALNGRQHESEQRQDAAFAVVRDAHHHADVAHEHDQDQRPQNEAEDSQHVVVRRRDLEKADEALAKRVQRARSDIAKDDAQRREGEGRLERAGRHAPWLAPGE